MRRIFSLVLAFCILCISVIANAATVTNARWGVDKDNNLRFVISVDTPVTYNVRLTGQMLKVLVNADLAKNAKGSWSVRSDLANSMSVNKEGALTVLSVPLKQSLTTDNYNTFVLRNGATKQEAYRIVVDVSKNTYDTTTKKPVVSSQPVKTANSGDTWNSKPATTSNGSWTDRFKKDGTVTTKPSASERVKQSIQQAREAAKEKQQENSTSVNANTTNNDKPVVTTNTAPASNNSEKQTAANTSAAVSQAKANTQSSLKKLLTAKQAARREAAAEAANKKKKDKNKNTVTNKETVNKNTVDGVVIIKGTGKYKTSGGIEKKVITIDAGHGGSDPGAIGAAGVMEKNLTLPIAKRLEALLTKAGAVVHMTRTTDVDVHGKYATDKQELQARVNVSEKFSSDLFISIHINASVNKDIAGVSSYYHPKTVHDARIARCIQNRLVAVNKQADLGIREAGFYVIKRNSMPATLLELGFITNKNEERLMNTAAYQEKTAQAIFEGIKKYFEG